MHYEKLSTYLVQISGGIDALDAFHKFIIVGPV